MTEFECEGGCVVEACRTRAWMLAWAIGWLAAAADAESLVSTGSGTWSGVSGGGVTWSGGTPSADDDFTIVSGHVVHIEDAVSLASGSVTVAAGGTLSVGAGAVLTPGAWLVVRTGATYEQLGTSLKVCRIQREPDWNMPDPEVTLSCPASSLASADDSLVFLDEDPPSGLWNGRSIVSGPGLRSGFLRTSLNRYAWYDITSLSSNRVSYDLDSGSYGASPGVPYRGSRGNPTPIPIGASQLEYTLQPGRRATRVAIAPSYGSVAAMHADLGSYYLYFTEDTGLASDSTRCSGRAAKILHSEDGGTGPDHLYVAGDVTACTHSALEARLIPGARRGDRVALVRPAVLDGRVAGANLGHVRFESGATVRVRWARFVALGYAKPEELSPRIRRNCNLCFLQSATAPGAPIAGFFEDTEIAFPEAGTGLTNDTGVLEFVSLTETSAPDYRFPDVGLLDMAGFQIARLHIHDNRNEAYSGGGHGIYIDGVKNLVIDGARVERTSDDLFGSNLAGNETGSASDANSFDVRRLLLYEAIAEHDNSQQCFEPAVLFGDGATATGTHNYQRQAGAMRATDVIAIGCNSLTVHVVGLGAVVDRIVSGGAYAAISNPTVEFYLLPGSGVLPSAFPNVARNAILTTYAEDGSRDIRQPTLIVRLEDSVLFGDEQSSDANNQHHGFQACVRSFWYHEGSSAHALVGNSQSSNVWGPLREWQDCAFVSATAERLAAGFSNYTTPHTLRFARLLYLQDRAWSTSFGALGSMTTEAGATLDLRGAFLSTGTAGWKDFDANPDGIVQDVCYESLNPSTTDFQGYASATTLSLPALTPDVADEPTVGELAGDPTSSDPCEAAKPAALGLADVGTAHVLLGDFALEQLEPVFTSHVGLVTVQPEASLPSPGAGCGLGPELVPALACLRAACGRRRCRGSAGRGRERRPDARPELGDAFTGAARGRDPIDGPARGRVRAGASFPAYRSSGPGCAARSGNPSGSTCLPERALCSPRKSRLAFPATARVTKLNHSDRQKKCFSRSRR